MELRQYIEIELNATKDNQMIVELFFSDGSSRIFWDYDELLKNKYGEYEVIGVEKIVRHYKIKLEGVVPE